MGRLDWTDDQLILAIDFDGVVHDFQHPIKGRRMGAPIDGAKEALQGYKQRGDKVVIYTIWPPSSHGVIRDWMNYYEIPFDDVTNVKQQADYYIDDKAIRFTNWVDVISTTN